MHLSTPGRTFRLIAGLLGLLMSLAGVATHAEELLFPARVAVYFSPNGGATDAVVRELTAAKTHVLMQAYSFTSAPIAKALVEAHKRGVKILAVLDTSNETSKYSAATFLTNAGMQPRIDDAHAIAHSKVMVIDSACSRFPEALPLDKWPHVMHNDIIGMTMEGKGLWLRLIGRNVLRSRAFRAR